MTQRMHYQQYSILIFETTMVILAIFFLLFSICVVANLSLVCVQGMAFQRDGILAESPDPRRMQLRVANKVRAIKISSGRFNSLQSDSLYR